MSTFVNVLRKGFNHLGVWDIFLWTFWGTAKKGEQMTTSTTQNPNEKTVRLLDYLLRLATLRSKPIRDISEYDTTGKILWVSSVPHEQGCFTQAWGPDEKHEPDEWIEVQTRSEPELPAVPDQCKEWINPTAL